MTNLVLVSVIDELSELQPAAMYEREAARYCKISLNDLRKYANEGRIVARFHPGRVRRIYLKSDLDLYLQSLRKEGVA